MPTKTKNFENWEEVVLYLQSFIVKLDKKGYQSKDWGLSRTKRFLQFLDNPQEKIQIFHIAGTSGKGSTSFLISQILNSQGLKAGLHLSPYLLDFRERFIINNQLPDKGFLTRKFNQFNQLLTNFLKQSKEQLTYFEIINCWTFWLFKEEKLDAGVIEVGMGGRFDATNCVNNADKICILNQTGLDHTEFLGDTPQKIATEQAEIINYKNPVVLIKQEFNEAQEVFLKKIKETKSNFYLICEASDAQEKSVLDKAYETKPAFDYQILNLKKGLFKYFSITNKKFIELNLNLKGKYQIANTALAIRSVEVFLHKKGQVLDINKLAKKLEMIQFAGRFEEKILNKNQFWIFDSAHNPQKMKNFIQALQFYHPNQKFIFFLAFSDNKNFISMLDDIFPFASQLVFSNFVMKTQGASKKSLDLEEVKKYLEIKKIQTPAYFLPDIAEATKKVLELERKEKQKVVATGSIYFLSEVYTQLGL
jgi:dihydrofolate synthase/folylpolyglutamate synthase